MTEKDKIAEFLEEERQEKIMCIVLAITLLVALICDIYLIITR